jgi:multiple sugar transport system substrate-binding protein
MRKEITFATVPIASEAIILQVLEEFEARHNTHVNLQMVSWDQYRQDFTHTAVHRLAGDVAVTGTPATSDLIAMNALRPYTPGEIRSLGGESSFLPSRWRSGTRPGSSEIWAIPWIVDIRLFYYRKDRLAEAGIDEAEAFKSPQSVEQSIRQLKESGIEYPWMAYFDRFSVLHRIASWIWAFGGDLFTEDGKRAIFHEKEALEGMEAYFKLIQYLPETAKNQVGLELVQQGNIGLTIENAWGIHHDVLPEIGCAAVPGGSYVGGSDLIIWKHSRNEAGAMELIRFLSQYSNSKKLFQETFYLPAQVAELDVISKQPSHTAQPIVQAALNGRTFPCVPMIGLIEERLGQTLLTIQNMIMDNPDSDITSLLRQYIVPLGKRTNISLDSIP